MGSRLSWRLHKQVDIPSTDLPKLGGFFVAKIYESRNIIYHNRATIGDLATEPQSVTSPNTGA